MKSLLIRFFSILLIIFSSSFVVGSTVFAA